MNGLVWCLRRAYVSLIYFTYQLSSLQLIVKSNVMHIEIIGLPN